MREEKNHLSMWQAYQEKYTIEGMACYSGLLLAPAEGLCLQPRLFWPFCQKKVLYAVLPILGNSSSTLNSFDKNTAHWRHNSLD